MSERAVLHLSIRGRVQGVGYRAFLEEEAQARGVAGWVRNRRDGSVEAVIAGASDVLDALIEKARGGPRSGLVTDVAVTPAREAALEGHGEDFAIRPTL